jgi:hypothetical protein
LATISKNGFKVAVSAAQREAGNLGQYCIVIERSAELSAAFLWAVRPGQQE